MPSSHLLAVQGTSKSLLEHHNSKASILWRSAFFTVQLSHPYMTTGKTMALTRRTFVGKIISLLFNMLSRFVTNFLPRSKHLLTSWLQSPSAVILEPPKIKSDTVYTVSASISQHPKTHINQINNIKCKEQILKASRDKQQITHKGVHIRITADLSIETLQARREWQDIFKVMKEKNLQPRLLYPVRISFKYEGEIKSFPDKQKLREFSTTKPALQQMLKDLL